MTSRNFQGRQTRIAMRFGFPPSLLIAFSETRRPAQRAVVMSLLLAMLGVPGCQPATDSTTLQQVSSAKSIASPVLEESNALKQAAVDYDTGAAAGHNSILESLGGGVGIFDYDADGRLDLSFPGGGRFDKLTIDGLPTRLLRQRGPEDFVDVAAAARMDSRLHFSHGCSVADIDNDGFDDLLISGYGGLTLWVNQGDGTFLNTTSAAGLTDDRWSTSAGWGDVNSDGVLDLYVCHYVNWSFENNPPCSGPGGVPDVCPPRQFDGVDDALYLGRGDGTFQDVSAAAGLLPAGKGLGVLLSDFDHDGDLDIYVANDTVPNFLYLNRGDGAFDERGMLSGAALDDMSAPTGSMGIALLDFDQDGWSDLWVTNYEDELFALYRNLGSGSFQHVSRKAGLNRLGMLYVGFGCIAVDLNLDGREDVAVANGHVVHHPRNAPVKQPRLALLNNGDGSFEIADFDGAGAAYSEPAVGRGLAAGDLDRDGRVDLVFTNSNTPAQAFYNRTLSRGESKPQSLRGLQVRLIGTQASRTAVGARAVLETTRGQLLRQLVGGGSYLSSSENVLQWYWSADSTPRRLIIHWPSGIRTEHPPEELLGATTGPYVRLVLYEPESADDSARAFVAH